MAEKDNSLGAPTEGLGQRVTFAFDPGNSPPTASSDGPVQLRGGIRGGVDQASAVRPTAISAPREDPTMAVLMKFGDAIMKPRMERARTEAFVSGMQRAMQGEAVADIAEQQPWYTKVFGDSDVVEGARAYAGQTIAQTEVAAMEDAMPDLRKMAPDEARKYFTDRVTSKLTGDKPTDMAVLQAMTRALPGVMRRQSKEHYGYQQEQAATQQRTAFQAGAVNLQKVAKSLANGFTTPEEFAMEQGAFERSLMPVAGQDEKNYKAGIKQLAINAALNGNMHAVTVMRGNGTEEKPGVLSILDADDQDAVSRAVRQGEQRLRADYTTTMSDRLVEIQMHASNPAAGMSTKQLAAMIDAENDKFKKATGTNADWIDADQRVALLTRNGREIAQEHDRNAERAATAARAAAAAGNKEQEAAILDSTIVQAVADGQTGALKANPKISGEMVNAVAHREVMRLGNPETPYLLNPMQVMRLVMNHGNSDDVIAPTASMLKAQVNAAVASGNPGQAWQNVFHNYTMLAEANPATADAYYGSKWGAKLAGVHEAIKNGASPEGAFQDWIVNGEKRASLSDKDMKVVLEEVGAERGWMARTLLGVPEIKPGSANRMIMAMADGIKQYAAAVGTKPAVERVMAARLNRDFELTGGYFMPINKGQQPVWRFMTQQASQGHGLGESVSPDTYQKVFEGAVNEALYGGKDVPGLLPDKASDIYIGRGEDVGGVPMLRIQAIVDGKEYPAIMSGYDIFEYYKKGQARKATEATRAKSELGQPFVTPGNRTNDIVRPNLVGKPTR